jgi:hypothetical protein
MSMVFIFGGALGMLWALYKENNLPDSNYAQRLESALWEFTTRYDYDGKPCWCSQARAMQQVESETWVHSPRCLQTREALEV